MVAEIGIDDAERKQVTVLFADVMGSMDMAEQHDPEEWRKIMQRFFSVLTDAVEAFEGTVDKFTGDGIMAVFGAPIAHEDHARRACYAALRMLEDVGEYAAELRRGEGLNFSVRVGINSGEVVAGAIGAGSSSSADYTAIGHTVGLAQRMEALAEPGKAYLTEGTAELAQGFLELADLGEFEIKGASRPIRVFELAGVGQARSRLDLSRERGFSRFVGRGREMSTLEEAFENAEKSKGEVVAVVADPGVGKSRLCLEFAERRRADGVEVFEAQAQSHGKSIPFMPVLQMMRAYFGIGDGDRERIAREKIAGRSLLLDTELADSLPLLFDFLGVPDPDRPVPQMSAEARQRALGDLVCRLVNAADRRETVVVLVEDLHWMDEASTVMLSDLVSSIESTKTLAIVNYRPEYTPPWEPGSYREVTLEPLAEADTREMLRDLAGADPSLDGLGELVHERTQGNPFFIEEIVRELAETGHLEGERGSYRLVRRLEEMGVPPTVQAILAARIDRLSPDAKLLLQVASVVGKELGARELRMTAGIEADELDPVLCELTEFGFLYEAELYPEKILAFRHPLTREVAYGTQLADRRAATHAAAARATIELNPDRHDELAALIADHLAQGGESLEAARWYARAAYRAGHTRPQDAMWLWQQVTGQVEDLEETEETNALAVNSRLLQLDFAWRLGMDRGTADALAAEASEIATRTGDLRSLAVLKLLTSARPGNTDHSSDWVTAAKEARQLADESGEDEVRIAVRAVGAYAQMCTGNLDGVEEMIDEMEELIDGDPTKGGGIGIECPAAWGLTARSMALRERDRFDEAEALLVRAERIAGEQNDRETVGWTLGSKCLLLADRGETEAALAMAHQNCEQTDQLGDVFSRTQARTALTYVQIAAGQFAEALETITVGDRHFREAMGSGGETEAWRATLRARALLGLGRNDEALEEIEWAANIARRRAMGWQIPSACHTLAQARAAVGAPGVEEALDEAIEEAESRDHAMTLRKIAADRETLLAATGAE
jgi:class 3 adenylate cyclase/tetratricopeptide (TPR) repeat protein